LSRPRTPSPRRLRARETCVPTKPEAPVTRTARLEEEERRADLATRFSQWEPPQESPRARRGEAEGDGGERMKRKRMNARKKEDQRVSLESEEWMRRRWWM